MQDVLERSPAVRNAECPVADSKNGRGVFCNRCGSNCIWGGHRTGTDPPQPALILSVAKVGYSGLPMYTH